MLTHSSIQYYLFTHFNHLQMFVHKFSRKHKKLALLIALGLLHIACHRSLPDKQYSQASLQLKYKQSGDSIRFDLSNPLHCPLRVSLQSTQSELQELINHFGTCTLQALADTALTFPLPSTVKPDISFQFIFGDPQQPVRKNLLQLPFPKGRTYRIIQGYGGSFSHNNDYSRYALDFDLQSGDTICSADAGYVIGVIKDYQQYGSTREWRDYANFITLYHPHSGLITQYVHLAPQGSFVSVGDSVTAGQPIGICGMTGWTSTPHLHFNVLVPDQKGVISTPISFSEGYKGEKLTKGSRVSR